MKKYQMKQKSIVRRTMVSNTLIMLLVFLISFSSIVSLSIGFSLSKEEKMADSYLKDTMNTIDNKLTDMARISMISFSDDQVQEIIKNYNSYSYKERLDGREYIEKLFLSLITIRNDINGIYIFDLESLIFRTDDIIGASEPVDFERQIWFPSAQNLNSCVSLWISLPLAEFFRLLLQAGIQI